jgi:sec-independent protein translocase protein TatA
MPSLGPWEIALILLLALLLFGAKKLPELARSVGQSMREFKKSVSGIGNEVNSTSEEDKSKAPKS